MKMIFCMVLGAVTLDASMSTRWDNFTPAKLKAAVPVALEFNPLLPSVVETVNSILPMTKEHDEFAPKLQGALSGKIRSVIHSANPVLLCGGRIYRSGEEVYRTAKAGGGEPLLTGYRTVLKSIEADRLVFSITSIDGSAKGRGESTYMLEDKHRKK